MKFRDDFTYEDLRDIYAMVWIAICMAIVMLTIAQFGGLL